MSYQNGLLHLCRSACEVFASQPTRLFLHGFYICSSLIELWVFDRSGLYCSDVFYIRTDYVQFISVIRSYLRMTNEELGKLNIIEVDEGGSYITLDSAETPSLGKLYLESQPIASRERLVGTGTTCYRARIPGSDLWEYVLKFKWRWARDRPEDELVKLASEKCVWGADSLDYYKEVESTSDLRRSMRWGTHRKFAGADKGNEGQPREATDKADGLAKYTEETRDLHFPSNTGFNGCWHGIKTSSPIRTNRPTKIQAIPSNEKCRNCSAARGKYSVMYESLPPTSLAIFCINL